MLALLAQKLCVPGEKGDTCVEGPKGLTEKFGPNFTLADIVNRALLFIFPIAGLILFVNILFAGFTLATSGGDPKKMEAAKGRLTMSILGFALLFLAFWVTQIVAYIFGIKGLF